MRPGNSRRVSWLLADVSACACFPGAGGEQKPTHEAPAPREAPKQIRKREAREEELTHFKTSMPRARAASSRTRTNVSVLLVLLLLSVLVWVLDSVLTLVWILLFA